MPLSGRSPQGTPLTGKAGCARREIITADPLRATPGHHENGSGISVLTAGASRLSRRSWDRLLGHKTDQRHCDDRQNRPRVEINQGVLLLKKTPVVADITCRAVKTSKTSLTPREPKGDQSVSATYSMTCVL